MNADPTLLPLIGIDAHLIARRRARYGHKEWIAWLGRDGVARAAPAGWGVVKAAMLACGTQGAYTVYHADGTSSVMTWRLSAVYLCSLRSRAVLAPTEARNAE
jgi:hypothetical protein